LEHSLGLQRQVQHRFHDDPYQLKGIAIQSVDFFGPVHLGFVKLVAEISNDSGRRLPGIVFLRGGSVALLIILRPRDARDERWVVTTIQPRMSSGSLSFMEIPAGIIDDQGTFIGAAAKELQEELGLVIPETEIIDMTSLALADSRTSEDLQRAMYTTPGGSDEFVAILLWEKILDRQEIEDLKDKLGGKEAEGETIALRLSDYEELWREGARDAKTLAAWALYEALKRTWSI
jgi:8-oxo-dGTP pyrophosphatase MutT (NUDIX family)